MLKLKQLSCTILACILMAPVATAHPRQVTASATYYSDYFKGRRMANGEKFRQEAMVAAHPFYKLGTRLKITYKGRSVYVYVKDRCRCSLDLSKAAFKQLAPLRQGRIPVKVQVLR